MVWFLWAEKGILQRLILWQFLVEQEGIYTEDQFFEQYGYSIDTEEAAEDAVNTDGVPHFFASYDGREVELDDGSVMYRVN